MSHSKFEVGLLIFVAVTCVLCSIVLTLTYFLLTVTDMEDGIRIREIRLEMSGKENFICCIAYQVTMM